MVIATVAICTRLGNPVICRNYVSIPFSRLEGLLSSFPRLISPSQQHSYVETAEARYLFQSLDQFFLVLITSKTSNLLKDLEVLRLAGRIVASQCPQIEEASLLRRYSDIIFAFDEIVTFGQREQITMPQVTAHLTMESAEEALQELIEKNKVQEAREISKMKTKQLELERRESGNTGSSGMLRKGLAMMRGSSGPTSPSVAGTSSAFAASLESTRVQTEHIDVLTPKGRSLRVGKGMALKKP